MNEPTHLAGKEGNKGLPLEEFGDFDADSLAELACKLHGISRPKRGERIQWPEKKPDKD